MKKFLALIAVLLAIVLCHQMVLGQKTGAVRYKRILELRQQKGVPSIELLGKLHDAIRKHDKVAVLTILDELPLIDQERSEVSSNTTWEGTTALIEAVKVSDEEIVRILLEADKETELGLPASPAFLDRKGRNPLFYVATPRIACMILKQGDISVKGKDNAGNYALDVLLEKLRYTSPSSPSFDKLIDTIKLIGRAAIDEENIQCDL